MDLKPATVDSSQGHLLGGLFPSFRGVFSASFLLTALASTTVAQSPTYRPPPPPGNHSSLEVRLRYLIPPDVTFSGAFGKIPLEDAYSSQGGEEFGADRSLEYEDGWLRQDYVRIYNEDGELQEIILSPNTDATAYFSYNDADQIGGDGTSLIYSRYFTESEVTEELEGNSSGSLGWELNYTRYYGRKRNLGIQVGFAFNGFDSDFNESMQAKLYRQISSNQMADGAQVPDLPDPVENEDGTVTQNPYTGPQFRDEGTEVSLLEWLGSEQGQELVDSDVMVDSDAELRSSVYSFRAGPTYLLTLGKRVSFQVGAGVSAIYFSGRLTAYQMLEIPDEDISISRSLAASEDAEWQVGGYVDANAYYNFNERVSLFSGLQVQSGSTYTQINEAEQQVNVDFSSQFYVHAGLGIRF
ncbi:MAG: hypothetical protein ACP5I4_12785 [Oceanipulchritudo sp.]